MVLVAQLVAFALLAIGTLAIPRSGKERLAARVAHREAERRGSESPLRPGSLPAQHPGSQTDREASDDVTHTDRKFFANWAGASYSSFPAGTFSRVTGTFVVPTLAFPPGAPRNVTYSAAIWVGIDGDTFQNAILQTGVDVTLQASTGAVFYDAWYEWWPANMFFFNPGITIRAGDTIRATVTATSRTSGVALIENLSTNSRVSQSLTSSSQLYQGNAEWIVEDFLDGGSNPEPFVDFDSVTFTGASATTVSGSVIGPGNATLIDIEQNGKIFTSSSVTSSSVTISFIG